MSYTELDVIRVAQAIKGAISDALPYVYGHLFASEILGEVDAKNGPSRRIARAALEAMEREPLDTAPPTWLVCVEGSEYGHIYSIHTDKAEAEEVAKKLSHQFPECYVSASPMMTLDIPVPNEGEMFFWVGDGLDDWEPMPLTEWRADDGFEDSVDYGKVLQRDIADGLVVSAATSDEATRRAAAKGEPL